VTAPAGTGGPRAGGGATARGAALALTYAAAELVVENTGHVAEAALGAHTPPT
jgi:hypothetical protein